MYQCHKPSLIGFRASASAWWLSQPINRKYRGSRLRKFSARKPSRTQTIRSRSRLRTKRRSRIWRSRSLQSSVISSVGLYLRIS
jgi:hypothetical protein